MNNFFIYILIGMAICLIGIVLIIRKGVKDANKNPMPKNFEDINLSRDVDCIMYREFRNRSNKTEDDINFEQSL